MEREKCIADVLFSSGIRSQTQQLTQRIRYKLEDSRQWSQDEAEAMLELLKLLKDGKVLDVLLAKLEERNAGA